MGQLSVKCWVNVWLEVVDLQTRSSDFVFWQVQKWLQRSIGGICGSLNLSDPRWNSYSGSTDRFHPLAYIVVICSTVTWCETGIWVWKVGRIITLVGRGVKSWITSKSTMSWAINEASRALSTWRGRPRRVATIPKFPTDPFSAMNMAWAIGARPFEKNAS